ncbi:unnamed protein product [Eruca vesicaria subsp. sativa]|uniref:Uncharacterized protein n=1 Tax=Eruca vesicaria subsp. sativa TaxID=29727 RepID=A0ABC8LCS6_ERUVS|nr:unnamed protein product [Eruca vesicaria subsp. sativa]
MASPTPTRIWFRILILISLMVVLFYVGRPLYWKISATIHDIRHNKQSVREGISQIVQEAQRSVGWYHDESDSGLLEVHNKKSRVSTSRKLLLFAGDQ